MSAWDSQFLLEGELRTSLEVEEFQMGLIGNGVFTTFAVYAGKPFAWNEHWTRLEQSAERLKLNLPEPPNLEALLEANGRRDAKVKICLLPIVGRKGRFLTMSGPLPEVFARIKLRTTDYRFNENSPLAGLKSMSYGEYLQIHPEGSKSASEVLVANTAGNLCEGTYSNVFVVKGGKIVTPPLESGCLPGVTRKIVLEIAEELGLKTTEEDVAYEELSEAKEVFMTSSLQGVQMGDSLNGQPLNCYFGHQIWNAYRARIEAFIA